MTSQLSIQDLTSVATSDEWLEQILSDMNTVELQATSWQSGSFVRTILQILAPIFAQQDGISTVMIQGGFFAFAASGVVSYVDAKGNNVTQPVTPDPSIPSQNPTGALGWLDTLATSRNVFRNGATPAAGALAIANTSSSAFGAYLPGTYHVSNPTSGATYSNTSSLTISAAVPLGGGISNASNANPISITTNSAHGLATGAIVGISGVQGNLAANGIFSIIVTSSNTFTLLTPNGLPAIGSGAYTSGGILVAAQTSNISADLAGPNGSSAAGTITQAVTANTGVIVANFAPLVGLQWESNASLLSRCLLKLQALSPDGPSGALQYFAQSAYSLLAAQTPPVTLTSAITQAVVASNNATGVVTVYVANANGAVSGVVQLAVSGATNASPIVVQTSSAHGLSTGAFVTLSGVQGNTNANGTWTATVIDSTHLSLNGSTGNATYTGGGSLEGGDLGQVDVIVQANAVPDSVTATTASVTNWNVAIVATITVTNAFLSTVLTNIQNALPAYVAVLGIGGVNTNGIIQYNDIVGIIYAAGLVAQGQAASYVKSIPTLTINGVAGNVSFPSPTSFAVLSPTPSIIGTGV